jgi:hypothetical protein
MMLPFPDLELFSEPQENTENVSQPKFNLFFSNLPIFLWHIMVAGTHIFCEKEYVLRFCERTVFIHEINYSFSGPCTANKEDLQEQRRLCFIAFVLTGSTFPFQL